MYCVFVLFFFVLCTLFCQFLWEGSYLRYLCLFTIHVLCFYLVFLRLVYSMLTVSLGRLLFTLFVFVYYTRIMFLFCFSSSMLAVSLEGSYLRYLCLFTVHVLCFCFVFLRLVYSMLTVSLGRLLFTLFVFVYYTRIMFLFCFSSSMLAVSLEGSYLRYLCLFTIHVLCFCFVFLRLVYSMLTVSLGRLLFTLFVFVYYTHIVFLFCFSSSCVPYVDSFSGRALIYVICVCLQYTYCVFVLFFFVLLAVSLGRLLFTLFVFVYCTHIVFLFCFSSSCVPYVDSFSGKALIYVICVCLLYTYCVFVLFFFVLCTLCCQFLWEGSYLRYLCLFTMHVLCFCFVFLRLVYPMLPVSLGGLLFTLFVFVYYTRIVFLFSFSSSCVPYVGSFSGRALIYVICVCLL